MGLVKLNDRGVRSATTFGSLSGGSMTFIKKLTASSSSDLSFVDGTDDVVLDDTYKEYMFTFKDLHPSEEVSGIEFQANTAGGSGYNETITSTYFRPTHNEDGTGGALAYQASQDEAQGTGFQNIGQAIGIDNDQSAAGYLHIFNPASNDFVKHFIAKTNNYHNLDHTRCVYTAGYFNINAAIDEFQFKFPNGNIDSGDICLYGIK
tara:strand:- start:50 stop:667 length:618 start_codon:yes stop_codon:yes gene_type:complete